MLRISQENVTKSKRMGVREKEDCMKRCKRDMGMMLTGIALGALLTGGAAAAGILAEPAWSPIYVNGRQVQMTAYNIAGNNYVKLRDIGKAVGFNVYYQDGVQVDSATPYTGEAPAQTPPAESISDSSYKGNTLKAGDRSGLMISPSGPAYTVTSSDPAVVAVEQVSGRWVAVAKSPGSAIITVSNSSGEKGSLMLTINSAAPGQGADSPVDLIRVATYLNTIPTAVDMIEHAVQKGYEVSCNIMAISNTQESDLAIALDILGQTPVDVFYIVDSYGALYPEQIARIVDIYRNFAEKYHKKIGIHAHNNQQLAFANTIEAVGDGVDWLDATYYGMGRGAGNCAMELLLGLLRNPKYHIAPVLKFIDQHMTKLHEKDVVWGYDLQYLMTGLLNHHPKTAIQFTKEKRSDYYEFYKEVMEQD